MVNVASVNNLCVVAEAVPTKGTFAKCTSAHDMLLLPMERRIESRYRVQLPGCCFHVPHPAAGILSPLETLTSCSVSMIETLMVELGHLLMARLCLYSLFFFRIDLLDDGTLCPSSPHVATEHKLLFGP